MDNQIDTNINVNTNASLASNDFKSLAEALKRVHSASNLTEKDIKAFSKTMGLTANEAKSLGDNLKTNEDGFRKVGKELGFTGQALEKYVQLCRQANGETVGLSGKIEAAAQAINQMKGVAQSAASVFGVTLSFKALEASAAKYTKTLFDLSRGTKAVGGNYADLKKSVDLLNKSTFMSMQDSADFALTLQRGVVGIRLTGDAVTKLGQTMSKEYGGSIEDIKKATQGLLDLQNKNIDVFNNLEMAARMDDKAFQGLLNSMKGNYGASREQIDTLIRLRHARKENGNQVNEEEKQLRGLSDSMQTLKKSGEDAMNVWGQQLANEFKTFNEAMAKTLNGIKDITVAIPGLIKVIGGIAVAGAFAGGVLKTVGIVKGLMGGGSASKVAQALLTTTGGINGKAPGAGSPAGAGSILGGPDGSVGKPFHVIVAGGMGSGTPDVPGAPGGGGKGSYWKYKTPESGLGKGANAAAGIWLTGAAIGGAQTLLSDKASTENVKGRSEEGTEDALSRGIANVFDPIAAGKDIGSAFRLLTQNAKHAILGPEGSGDGAGHDEESKKHLDDAKKRATANEKEIADARDLGASHEKLVEIRARQTKDWLEGLEKGQTAEMRAQKAQAEAWATNKQKEDEEAKTLQDQQVLRDNIIKRLEQEKMLNQTLISSSQAQVDYGLKYNNDIEGSLSLLDGMKEAMEGQLERAKEAVKVTEENNKALLKHLDTEEAIARKIENREQREEAIKAVETSRKGTQAETARRVEDEVKAQSALQQIAMQRVNIYKEQLAVADAQIGAMQAEVDLNNQLFMGMAPSLDAQNKLLDAIEQKMALIDKEIAFNKTLLSDQKRSQEAQRNLFNLQQQRTGLVAQELNITKALREGYLDAMGAFNNVSGSFTKIIAKQDVAVGVMVDRFRAMSTMRFGGEGGLESPFMRYTENGMIMGSEDEVGETYKTRMGGTASDIAKRGRNRGATAASAMSEMSETAREAELSRGGGKALGMAQELARAQSGVVGDVGIGGGAGTGPGSRDDWVDTIAAGIRKAGVGGYGSRGAGSDIDKKAKEEKKAKEDKKAEEAVKQAVMGSSEARQVENRKEKEAEAQSLKEARAADRAAAGVKNMTEAELSKEVTRRTAGVGGVGAADRAMRRKSAGKAGPQGASGDAGAADSSDQAQRTLKLIDQLTSQGMPFSEAFDAMFPNKSKGNIGRLEDNGLSIQEQVMQEAFTSTDPKTGETLYGRHNKKDNIRWKQEETPEERTTRREQWSADASKENQAAIERLTESLKEGQKVTKDSTYDWVQGMHIMTEQTKDVIALQNLQANPTGIADAGSELLDEIKSEINNPGSTSGEEGYATGGFVPGAGNKDSVPAMLMPGEFVMKKDAAKRYGWLLNSLNENQYATGGYVGGGVIGSPPPAETAGASLTPRININVRGDSVNKMMKTVTTQLYSNLNRLLVPQGTSGRQFDQMSTT